MALLLIIALLSVTATLVALASNKTNCDVIRNNGICIQTPCLQSPCTMQCGLATKYDICLQACHSNKCDVLECRATERCQQTFVQNTFASMTCDAKDCSQSCSLGHCSSMRCLKSVSSCVQTSGNKMSCEAVACTQSCPKGECQMICPLGGKTCAQAAMKGNALMECESGECEQHCILRGQCRMSCSSNLTTGSCHQVCNDSKCESMVCNTAKCTQICFRGDCEMACPIGAKTCIQTAQLGSTSLRCNGELCKQSCTNGDCNLVCPVGVKTCRQSATGGNVTMQCDGDVCKQSCTGGDCKMICSASVKECHQACSSERGNCHFNCKAEMCELTCLGLEGSCTAVISDASLKIESRVFWGLMLALIVMIQVEIQF